LASNVYMSPKYEITSVYQSIEKGILSTHQRFPVCPQLPADHRGGGVRALLPPVPQGHPEGPGGDVPWGPAPSPGPLPQELPAAVHPQHPPGRRGAARVRHFVLL